MLRFALWQRYLIYLRAGYINYLRRAKWDLHLSSKAVGVGVLKREDGWDGAAGTPAASVERNS